jgi:hypothetical protein
VHIAVSQPVGGKRIQIGCVDWTAVTTKVTEAGVVKDDEQHVRRAFPRPVGSGPRGLGHIEGSADNA